MAVYGTFASVTGQTLERVLWPIEGTPRGVVQLVHGMAEHISRYDAAAQALNAAGYAVVAVSYTHLDVYKRQRPSGSRALRTTATAGTGSTTTERTATCGTTASVCSPRRRCSLSLIHI